MATVVTVMNMKGGVGKTTVCAHLAGMLAHYEYGGQRRRVLAIDYDPQFNLSQMYIPHATYFSLEKEGKTSLAILKDDETKVAPFHLDVPGNQIPPLPRELAHKIYPLQNGGRLDLVPSTLDLMYIALGQTTKRTNVYEERFRKFIDACRAHYDVVLIDCHPAGSILTKTSLANSDHVVIPVLASQFSSRGIALMREFIKSMQRKLPFHIIFNNNGTRASKKDEDAIRADPHYAKHCLVSSLRKWKALSDPSGGGGFVWYSGRPHSRNAWSNVNTLVKELVARLSL
jgi:chromosome partitioning protein